MKRILYVLLVLVLLSGITGADRLIYSSGLNGSESDVSINQAGISEIYVSDENTELIRIKSEAPKMLSTLKSNSIEASLLPGRTDTDLNFMIMI